MFSHRQTGELVAFAEPDQFTDTDAWRDEMDQINAHPDDYREIFPMSSQKSFQLMEAFINQLPSGLFRNRLQHALNQPKPFRHFKQVVDHSGPYRQDRTADAVV